MKEDKGVIWVVEAVTLSTPYWHPLSSSARATKSAAYEVLKGYRNNAPTYSFKFRVTKYCRLKNSLKR
jgi:hypothetical protein